MHSPQFLARLRAYLASGGKEGFDGGIRGLVPTTMPVTSTSTPAPGMSRPPPGYRPGIDAEFNYGFLPPVKNDTSEADSKKAKKKTTGGYVDYMYDGGDTTKGGASLKSGSGTTKNYSTAANTAKQTVAAASERAQPASNYNSSDRDSSNRSYGGKSVNLNKLVDVADKANESKEYTGFWDRINGAGPGAGYTGLFDMINGGGMGGSYANPGTNIRGLGAVVYDLQNGGISALARDAVNGGGLGASDDKFRGGKRAMLLNALGIRPAGDKKSIFNAIPEASPELEERWANSRRGAWKDKLPEEERDSKFNLNNLFGTAPTAPTGGSSGGIIRFAEGGIMDIPTEDAPMQPPAGNEKDLISTAIAAIKGQVEDPRPVLGVFLAKYGEDALRNLVDKVESGEVDQTAARSEGMLKGPGDGMDDRIPAKVENGHDVLLANNEYIVPADVVSALGNGSSDAGAEHMDKMLDRVRAAAHGKTTQQKKVSADKVLPA